MTREIYAGFWSADIIADVPKICIIPSKGNCSPRKGYILMEKRQRSAVLGGLLGMECG